MDDVTLGELGRRISRIEFRLDRFEEGQDLRFAALTANLTDQIKSLQFVSRDAFNALARDVEELKESKKWLVRTLALAFLMAVMAPIVVALVVGR